MLECVEFTELSCNRKNWNGGLLIHMSQVRVLPGEPVFSMFFDIPTATNLQVCLTLVGLLPFDAVYHPLHGSIQDVCIRKAKTTED